MTITRQKIGYGVLTLALAASICVFPAASAHAASYHPVDPHAGVEYETIHTPVDKNMSDFVKELPMLTEAEKQQLIDESVATQPICDRISALEEEIDVITNKILEEAESLFQERGDIFDEHEALWAKLWNNMNDEQNKLEDYTAIIKGSTALTDSEKEILLKAQAHLDVIDAGIDGYYEKAAEATKYLTVKRDAAIAELQKIYAKSGHIWDKVYGE